MYYSSYDLTDCWDGVYSYVYIVLNGRKHPL